VVYVDEVAGLIGIKANGDIRLVAVVVKVRTVVALSGQ
jgi:hypothetical protein